MRSSKCPRVRENHPFWLCLDPFIPHELHCTHYSGVTLVEGQAGRLGSVFISRSFNFPFERPTTFTGYIGKALLEHTSLSSLMLEESFFCLEYKCGKISVLKVTLQSLVFFVAFMIRDRQVPSKNDLCYKECQDFIAICLTCRGGNLLRTFEYVCCITTFALQL